MEIHYGLSTVKKLDSSIITIGSYDGIHRGHFHLISKVKSLAVSNELKSVLITFNPHPRSIVNEKENTIDLIMSLDRKIEILRKIGLDILVVLEFDLSLMMIEAKKFLDSIVVDYFNPSTIIAGKNHTFGFKRSGDIKFLGDYCKNNKIQFEIVKPLKDGEIVISSTNIRKLIESGYIRRANYELGSIFGFYANVVSGSGRGHKLKYPTANLISVDKNQLFPKKGVYFTRCIIDGLSHYGMCNFGTRPTFGEDDLVLEVHLLNDYSKDFYNDIVWIEFLERIRSEVKFSSVNKLTEQLYKDKNKIFNTPAFNYDEVVTLPKDAILLSSNKVNNVMALNFETEFSKIWGIQYHPEITYEKMITLIRFRRERLLENKSFSDDKDLESHISMIEKEDKITKKESRMRELKNWLDLIS